MSCHVGESAVGIPINDSNTARYLVTLFPVVMAAVLALTLEMNLRQVLNMPMAVPSRRRTGPTQATRRSRRM